MTATLPSEPALAFLPDVQWLQPDFVAQQISGISGSGGSATPGLHGDGLGTVSLGGVALTPGGSTTVQLTKDIAFDVQVVNQGDSTETDVGVTVTVGSGGDAMKLEETIPEIAAGEQKTASIPLTSQPPDRPERSDHGEREGGAGRAGHGQQQGRLHGHLHPLSRSIPWRPWTI